MNQYQGYQPVQSQQQTPQQRPMQQEVKFYKSGLFGLSSAAGRYQRDVQRMQSQGWHVKDQCHLGVNLLGRRIISVVYERI